MLRKAGFTTRQLRWAYITLQRDVDDGLLDTHTANKVRVLLFGQGKQEFLDELPSSTMPHRNRLHKPTYTDQNGREYFFEDTAPVHYYQEQYEEPPAVYSETDSWLVGLPLQHLRRSAGSSAMNRQALPQAGQELTLTRVRDGAEFTATVRYVPDSLDATARVRLDTVLPTEVIANVESVFNSIMQKAMATIIANEHD